MHNQINAYLSSQHIPNIGLLSDNMVPLQRESFALLVLATLIILGNTCFPICLRFMIYVRYKLFPNWEDTDVYEYLLKNPRQCFTHLFPSAASRWLGLVLAAFLVAEWAFILVSNMHKALQAHITSFWYDASIRTHL